MGSDREDEPKELEFPAKKTNDGDVKNANGLGIVMNAYSIRLDGTVKEVYKYELKFFIKRGDREPRELSRGPKNDVSNEHRRKLLWELFQILLASDDDFFGTESERRAHYCYDCGINMYSIKQLMKRKEERCFTIEMDKIPDDCRHYVGRSVDSVEARLLATEKIDLFDKTVVEDITQGDRSVIQFLEILSSQKIISEGKHHIFPQKMFEKSSSQTLQRDPRILKDGMQKNVRFVGDSIEAAQPIIQIDPKKAAFFPTGALGKFLEEMIGGNDKLVNKIFVDRNLKLAVKQVKNLVVRTNHLDLNRTFAINGLTADGANKVKFDIDGKETTVDGYFKEKYNIELRYPKLPCAIERRLARIDGQNRKVENYYPIEVLEIVDGQRVSIQKQTPALTEQMIRQCQALPKVFKELNEKQRAQAFIASGNPYFKAHGVRASTEMLCAQAEILFPPALLYDGGKDREEPRGAELIWKLGPQRKFLVPAESPPVWAAVIFQRGVQAAKCQEFINRMLQSANQRGFPLRKPNRYDEWDETTPDYISQKFAFYAKNKCKYVLFFTKEKLDPVHHIMKHQEIQHGIVTQHVSAQTMEKGAGQKGAFLVLDNVLMKMHLKLGGVNHGLSTARDMQRANKRFAAHDVVGTQWLAPTRMFVGLDFSHAGPQSLYERQAGQSVSDPTIIGMAYTCGEPCKIRGTYWLQEPRVTIIQELKRHLIDAIDHFASDTGKPPASLIIYRGGVSEGEYRKVITDELAQIQKALEELKEKHKGHALPKVSIIVAQRKSNYRIVPQNINPKGRPMEQNVPAGTVVDKTIMHPTLTDVLMVGHKTIQGTANPVRYTMLVDEHDMSLSEMEYVTYHLCYTHGVVCSPVSVPGPLYAAADLAKRGRNNWQQHNQAGDTVSMASGESGGRFKHDGSETFFEERSRELQPTVHTKFWA
ncbi:piwi domain-containing protein [Aphelenchoides avenae]|nr:piwi domain-containing protein [Aphelenchus avenae]